MNLTSNLEGKQRDITGVCSAMINSSKLDDEIAKEWGWTMEELSMELRRRMGPITRGWRRTPGFPLYMEPPHDFRIVTPGPDPKVSALRKKIQQAEDQLCDLEDQKMITQDDRDSISQLISEQKEYLTGLYESMNKMMANKGL